MAAQGSDAGEPLDVEPDSGLADSEGDVWTYIEDMLAQMADLAARHGRFDLATHLRLLAVDAARASKD